MRVGEVHPSGEHLADEARARNDAPPFEGWTGGTAGHAEGAPIDLGNVDLLLGIQIG
jgi:hypothetical protein